MRPIDANKFLVSARYLGRWDSEKLPTLKATISEEIRDKYFKSSYRIDELDAIKYQQPVTTWFKEQCKQIEKEKERIIMYEKVKVLFDGHSYYPTDVRISARPGETTVLEIECPVGYAPYHAITPKKPEPKFPGVKKVIFNDPATIVLWEDNTKTVVKCENEKFDPEKGLAMAITKKVLGNTGHYFETIKKHTRDWYVENVKNEVIDDGTLQETLKKMREIINSPNNPFGTYTHNVYIGNHEKIEEGKE